MSMDLAAPGSHFVEGTGTGTTAGSPLRQTVEIDQTNKGALPVTLSPTAVAQDGSGTIATGGVAQSLFGGATPANGFMVQNTASSDLWVNDAGTATAAGSSFYVPPNGGAFATPLGYKVAGAVSIFGAVTGQTFAARRW